MYLARHIIQGKTCFILRESFKPKGKKYFKHRDVFDLGADPRLYIHYPGGNAFYIDTVIEEQLYAQGVEFSDDELEDLLWPFVKREIRLKVEPFRRRYSKIAKQPLSKKDEQRITEDLHIFDKRRLHFLRYGSLSQARLYKAPLKLFRPLLDKSRDEIEQYFLQQEQVLDASDYRTYVYVIFNLQRFFSETAAQVMPGGLNQQKLDAYFDEE